MGRHQGPPQTGDVFGLGWRLDSVICFVGAGAVVGALDPTIPTTWWERLLTLQAGLLGLAWGAWQFWNYVLRERNRAD